jgi:TubC N-terminal docking domain
MHVRDLLIEIAERAITLTCGRTEDRLNAKPTSALTPELIVEIKEHKHEIIQILRNDECCREDRRLKETGVIQSQRQVFELARVWFGEHDQSRSRGICKS